MNQYIDLETSLELIDFLIQAGRENLCWLMSHVSLDREDSWRDRKFNEIQTELNNLVIQREVLLAEKGK